MGSVGGRAALPAMRETWAGWVRGDREFSLRHALPELVEESGWRYRASGQSEAGSWMPGLEGGCLAGASGKVDPIYETLRYGTSLALMNRSSFSSTSESPTRSLVCGHQRGILGTEVFEDEGPGDEPSPVSVPRVSGMS